MTTWTYDTDDASYDAPCPECGEGPLSLKGYGMVCPTGHIIEESYMHADNTDHGAIHMDAFSAAAQQFIAITGTQPTAAQLRKFINTGVAR